jgi:hypothetical protein
MDSETLLITQLVCYKITEENLEKKIFENLEIYYQIPDNKLKLSLNTIKRCYPKLNRHLALLFQFHQFFQRDIVLLPGNIQAQGGFLVF